MNSIEISDEANKILENYLAELKLNLKNLPVSEMQETINEIHSDILSVLLEQKAENPTNEIQFLLLILDKLGKPFEVADEILSKKLTSFQQQYPRRHLIFASKASLGALIVSVTSLLSLILYFFGFLNLAMALLKPFIPERIGLFIANQSFHSYGILLKSSLVGTGTIRTLATSELFGYWIIPIGIILGGVLIFSANFLIIKTRKILY